MKKLGDKIKEARNQKGWTLDELAKKSGVSKAYLSQLENSDSERPSAEKLYNIAIALGVSIAELLGKKLEKVEEIDKSIPANLEKAAVEFGWTQKDKELLASIAFRTKENKKSLSTEDWRYLYDTIKRITNKN